MKKFFKGGVALGLLVAGSACQTYTPLSVAPSTVGSDVRVTLTEGATRRLIGPLGVGAQQIEGKVRSVSDSAIGLSVTQVTRLSGIEERWNGEPYSLDRADIATVESKRTSVGRSALLAAAFVGGAILIGKAGSSGDQVNGKGGGPPGTGK